MDLPHPVHPAVEAHYPGGEGAIGRRPLAGRLGLQVREPRQPLPGSGEGGAARALVPGPGADGCGAHVDELQEDGGAGAGSHALEDTSKSRRKSFAAPITRVVRVEAAPRPREGYVYRLDLECGHRASRKPVMGSLAPRLVMAPHNVRCFACLAVLEGGRLPTQAGGELAEELPR